jgi:hypothetical protein
MHQIMIDLAKNISVLLPNYFKINFSLDLFVIHQRMIKQHDTLEPTYEQCIIVTMSMRRSSKNLIESVFLSSYKFENVTRVGRHLV